MFNPQGSLSPLVVQSLSCVWLFATLQTAAQQASLSFTISQSLLKLMSIESAMPANHLILCHPLLLLPSIFPSIRVFPNESALPIRWPKYWSFSFSISPSNEYSGLIFLRIDLFDILAVQGTLKSLLQHHSSSEAQARGVRPRQGDFVKRQYHWCEAGNEYRGQRHSQAWLYNSITWGDVHKNSDS